MVTLAAQIFCALIAIAAAFNLEIQQHNAVNVFTNAKLNKLIYCYCLEGFDQNKQILKLLIALYRLKISPLLWYKELTNTLTKFGLKPVPDTNCLYTNGQLIIFFYIDGIAVLYAKKDLLRLEEFKAKLLHQYKIYILGDLQWFLKI